MPRCASSVSASCPAPAPSAPSLGAGLHLSQLSRFRGPSHLRAPNRSAPVSGVVKWFSPEKGFGFVELSDGSGDAFLHGSLPTQGGIAAVQPGEKVALRPTAPVDIGARLRDMWS